MNNSFVSIDFFPLMLKHLLQYGNLTITYNEFLPEGYELPINIEGITLICERPSSIHAMNKYYIHKNDRLKAMENFFKMMKLKVIIREINIYGELGLHILWAQQ